MSGFGKDYTITDKGNIVPATPSTDGGREGVRSIFCVWCGAYVEFDGQPGDEIAAKSAIREHSATCPEHPAVKELVALRAAPAREEVLNVLQAVLEQEPVPEARLARIREGVFRRLGMTLPTDATPIAGAGEAEPVMFAVYDGTGRLLTYSYLLDKAHQERDRYDGYGDVVWTMNRPYRVIPLYPHPTALAAHTQPEER